MWKHEQTSILDEILQPGQQKFTCVSAGINFIDYFGIPFKGVSDTNNNACRKDTLPMASQKRSTIEINMDIVNNEEMYCVTVDRFITKGYITIPNLDKIIPPERKEQSLDKNTKETKHHAVKETKFVTSASVIKDCSVKVFEDEAGDEQGYKDDIRQPLESSGLKINTMSIDKDLDQIIAADKQKRKSSDCFFEKGELATSSPESHRGHVDNLHTRGQYDTGSSLICSANASNITKPNKDLDTIKEVDHDRQLFEFNFKKEALATSTPKICNNWVLDLKVESAPGEALGTTIENSTHNINFEALEDELKMFFDTNEEGNCEKSHSLPELEYYGLTGERNADATYDVEMPDIQRFTDRSSDGSFTDDHCPEEETVNFSEMSHKNATYTSNDEDLGRNTKRDIIGSNNKCIASTECEMSFERIPCNAFGSQERQIENNETISKQKETLLAINAEQFDSVAEKRKTVHAIKREQFDSKWIKLEKYYDSSETTGNQKTPGASNKLDDDVKQSLETEEAELIEIEESFDTSERTYTIDNGDWLGCVTTELNRLRAKALDFNMNVLPETENISNENSNVFTDQTNKATRSVESLYLYKATYTDPNDRNEIGKASECMNIEKTGSQESKGLPSTSDIKTGPSCHSETTSTEDEIRARSSVNKMNNEKEKKENKSRKKQAIVIQNKTNRNKVYKTEESKDKQKTNGLDFRCIDKKTNKQSKYSHTAISNIELETTKHSKTIITRKDGQPNESPYSIAYAEVIKNNIFMNENKHACNLAKEKNNTVYSTKVDFDKPDEENITTNRSTTNDVHEKHNKTQIENIFNQMKPKDSQKGHIQKETQLDFTLKENYHKHKADREKKYTEELNKCSGSNKLRQQEMTCSYKNDCPAVGKENQMKNYTPYNDNMRKEKHLKRNSDQLSKQSRLKEVHPCESKKVRKDDCFKPQTHAVSKVELQKLAYQKTKYRFSAMNSDQLDRSKLLKQRPYIASKHDDKREDKRRTNLRLNVGKSVKSTSIDKQNPVRPDASSILADLYNTDNLRKVHNMISADFKIPLKKKRRISDTKQTGSSENSPGTKSQELHEKKRPKLNHSRETLGSCKRPQTGQSCIKDRTSPNNKLGQVTSSGLHSTGSYDRVRNSNPVKRWY